MDDMKRGASAADSKGEGCVLVVNDDTALLIAMKFVVKGMGVPVVTADSVEGAMEERRKSNVTLIISDIDFGRGKMTGYDFLQLIRKEDHCVPFYLMSGSSQEDEGQKAFAMGANGYIQLPAEASCVEKIFKENHIL